jgi:O-antigen/teichoic acid export membrane protein
MLKNVVANYISRIWSFISVFLFVPIYVKILGLESYAVINFYNVILAVMLFADAGLSSTLNREIARYTDKVYLGNMLFTIEKLYFFITSSIVILIFFLSNFIANKWLHSNTISIEEISHYITLMGIAVALQLFTTLENSGLMGLEKQVLANTIQVTGSILRSAVVLIPLFFSPTLTTFFTWQIFINLLIFITTRYYLWSFIKSNYVNKFQFEILKTVGKFAGGMMLMSIIASLNSQIDKILISKIFTLKEFGYYSLAGMLSQIPVIIITPIALALLPRMVKLITNKKQTDLIKLFHSNSYIIASISSAGAISIFIFTHQLVFVWTKDMNIANNIDQVTRVLLIGNIFLAFQYMPYHLAIANGHTKTNVNAGIITVLLIIPAIMFFVKKFQLIGATFPWLMMNILAFLYLGYILINKFLPGNFLDWLIKATLTPLIVSIIVGGIYFTLATKHIDGYNVLFYMTLNGLSTLIINLLIYNKFYPDNKISFEVLSYAKKK